MQMRRGAALLAAMALTGCLEVDQTDSGFKTPSSSGALSGNTKSNVLSGSEFSSLTGNGFAYQAGAVNSEGFQAYAGLVPGADVGATPVTGSASMSGSFEVAASAYILRGGNQISGEFFIDRGNLTLQADFGNGTLTGSGRGLDGGFQNIFLNENEIVVNGSISSGRLGGTVTYDGVSGPLTGLIGTDEAIGAFHGNTDSRVQAGGFIVR